MEFKSSFLTEVATINTYDRDEEYNGFILPIVNENEPGTIPMEQVYITVCEPGKVKGPHMHYSKKVDRFYCIEGRAAVVCRNEQTGAICEYVLSALDNQMVVIPPYNSHALVALDNKRAAILSIPNEGYSSNEIYNQVETGYENYNWEKWF